MDKKRPTEVVLVIVSLGRWEIGITGCEQVRGKGVAVGDQRLFFRRLEAFEKGAIGDQGVGLGSGNLIGEELVRGVSRVALREKGERRKFCGESWQCEAGENQKGEQFHRG